MCDVVINRRARLDCLIYCYTRALLIVSYRSKTYYTPLSRKKGISASTVAKIAAS